MSLFKNECCNGMYIIRTENSGVSCGEISEVNESTRRCDLKNARRLWYWDGAASLSELAMEGTCKYVDGNGDGHGDGSEYIKFTVE